jgi:hypothetical protein
MPDHSVVSLPGSTSSPAANLGGHYTYLGRQLVRLAAPLRRNRMPWFQLGTAQLKELLSSDLMSTAA